MSIAYTTSKTTENQFTAGKEEFISAYMSSWEHLADELRRLDLLLKLRVTGELHEADSRYAGLALSEGEIASLLDGEGYNGYDESYLIDELTWLGDRINKRLEASFSKNIRLSLPYISKLLNLSRMEEHCIIICLAPELDRKYEKIFAYLQNDMTAKNPSIDLILQLIAGTQEEKIAARSSFDPQAPLMKFLMDIRADLMDTRMPLITRPLKLDDWVVNFLLDFHVLDMRLAQVAEMLLPNAVEREMVLADSTESIIKFVEYYRQRKEYRTKQIFYLFGPDGGGKRSCAAAVCRGLEVPLISVSMEKVLASEMAFSETLRLLGRQAMLGNTALCIEGFDSMLSEDGRHQLKLNMLLQMITEYVPLTFILGEFSWSPMMLDDGCTFVGIEFPVPDGSKRKDYWKKFSTNYKLSQRVDMDNFSEYFRFTPGQIQNAINRGESLAVWHGSAEGLIESEELFNACYSQSNQKLGTLAAKIKKTYTWGMLVLPSDQMSQLREICNQVKYRSLVYGTWGFERRLSLGKGLNILFSGPPGSGKTMAAEVIAHELKLEIYKIDVSQVVSKYIGETEKNLSRIFSEAETSNAILFFDEADALFGKRSEVKDAHDRYANVEISYLLQKMEEYNGVVVLATNLNQNMDEAFLRRLHFNVSFPFPDKEQRKLIWQGIFPSEAPLDRDIDYEFLAEKFILAGGNIKNIALNAAFYAADASCQIGMKQIMLAARREYKKLGKSFLKSDFDPYYQLIEVM